jgi:hypothetical protein
MYLGMMRDATKTIDGLGKIAPAEVAAARGDIKGVPGFVQNLMAKPEAQQYAQAGMQWSEAMLRITTGATAPPAEVIANYKTFFPQIGDSKAVIEQKDASRKQMEKFVRLKAGGGAKQIDELTGNGGWSITPVSP